MVMPKDDDDIVYPTVIIIGVTPYSQSPPGLQVRTEMSSGGTQSPPLEFTDSHMPMGVSCIDGSVSKPVLDAEQRKTYFAEPVREQHKGMRETGKEKQEGYAKENH